MKKKIVWLAVSGLVVLSLVLASCAPATPTTPTTPATPTIPTTPTTPTTPPDEHAGKVKLSLKKLDGTSVEKWVEPPKYGGTYIAVLNTPIPGWDDFYTTSDDCVGTTLVGDRLLTGDWIRGPAGSEETTWWGGAFYLPFMTSGLAESWEFPDPETIIFHIRKGIRWQSRPPVNGREFTADDAAFAITRVFSNAAARTTGRFASSFRSATATDKYTIVIKGKVSLLYSTPLVFEFLTSRTHMIPREVIDRYGDMRDWRNAVGTGPFMVVDNVEGSSATFVRNSNYWGKDPLFPDNQLPYVDKVTYLIMQDASTRIAALRTGKVDALTEIPLEDASNLNNTNPELKSAGSFSPNTHVVWLRSDTKPFDDIRVRQALHMAIDFKTIARDYYKGKAEIIWAPVPPVQEFMDAYTPLEQLPESTRELYAYQPEKAKQLLAEAGYPNGFKFSLLCYKDQVDMASIVADYLSKIKVNMELDTKEVGVFTSMRGSKTYKDAVMYSWAVRNVYTATNLEPTSTANYGRINDAYINERLANILSFENMGKQGEINRLCKEYALYALRQAWAIDVPATYIFHFWQPWLKNYYGVRMVGAFQNNLANYVWIDQDLK